MLCVCSLKSEQGKQQEEKKEADIWVKRGRMSSIQLHAFRAMVSEGFRLCHRFHRKRWVLRMDLEEASVAYQEEFIGLRSMGL